MYEDKIIEERERKNRKKRKEKRRVGIERRGWQAYERD